MVLQRDYTFEFGVQQIENALSVVPYGKIKKDLIHSGQRHSKFSFEI